MYSRFVFHNFFLSDILFPSMLFIFKSDKKFSIINSDYSGLIQTRYTLDHLVVIILSEDYTRLHVYTRRANIRIS